MKRILVVLSLILSTQFIYAQGVRLGLKLHPLISYYKSNTDKHEPNGSSLGFSYGLMGSFNFTDNYSFATEFSVTTIPGSIIASTDSGFVESNFKLQYIEIPLTIKLRTDEIGKIVYFGQFGLGTAINITASSKTIFTHKTTNKSIETNNRNIGKDINLLRASLIIAGGVEYSLGGNTAILAGITFNNGFTDIISSEKTEYSNSYFALNLGILF